MAAFKIKQKQKFFQANSCKEDEYQFYVSLNEMAVFAFYRKFY
jgi:hypothetical protein